MSCVAGIPDCRAQRGGDGIHNNPNHATPARFWVMILAGFGLLVGPLFIAALVLLPLAILKLGANFDDVVVQGVGVCVLAVHGLAVVALLRVRRQARTRRQAVAVSSEDAPELHEMIVALAEKLNAPQIKRVLIDTELNASVAQIPVCFGLAGHRHELRLGLPLLQTISRNELAAVIAHELAHCRRSDGRLHATVFRALQQWLRLERASRNGSFLGRPLLNGFARCYLPLLERQSAQVLRSGEYIADKEAARAVGADVLARALVRAHAAHDDLRDAWDRFWLRNVHEARPVAGPWQTFARTMQPRCHPAALADLPQKPTPQSEDSDVRHHPSLEERLAALQLPENWARTTAPGDDDSAASAMLGNVLATITRHFDALWWLDNGERWESFHAGVAAQKARLRELDDAAARDELSIETAIERATRAEYLIGPSAAIARYRWCVNRFPVAATAYAHLGELLVRLGQQEGHAFLTHARSLEANAT